MNKLANAGFAMGAAIATVTVTLVAFWPRQTRAEEVAESDRYGEWDDGGGMRFGNIVVKGALMPDATVPGGWVLVRSYENRSDARDKCTVEEQVLRTETMLEARVEPAPFAVVARTQTFELGPHQKRVIGIPLAESLGKEITTQARKRTTIEAAHARMIETGEFSNAIYDQTFMSYTVGYLKPLPPGATAAPHENSVMHPARMPGP